MSNEQNLSARHENGVCTLTLNRPDKRNAFDDSTIKQLLMALSDAAEDASVRVIVLTGTGDVFSSGADLKWMASMVDFDYDHNYMDAAQLARLLRTLRHFPKPTVARVNGGAFGGAVGLIACCDLAVAVDTAQFGFTEVRLGLAPAVISPYVIGAIGTRMARQLFLTGELFSAQQALAWGLLTDVVAVSQLEAATLDRVTQLSRGGPRALRACKELVDRIVPVDRHIERYTVTTIAELRRSAEGQEGIKAFLEKRKPAWVKK